MIQAIDAMPVAQRTNELKGLLTTRINSIKDVLPAAMRNEAEAQRLVNRAAMYFAAKREVQEYSTISVVQAIIQAAELGLAVDGRLAHIVKFKGEAVLVIDWKGLVAVAKRSGVIYDCYADIVGKNDSIVMGRRGPDSQLDHQPNLDDRGEVRGAYAIVKFNEVVNGQREWRYEYMTRPELDKVKNSAPSKNGPWSTWPEEMMKKTVIRRMLKAYSDDPALAQALEVSDKGDGYTFDVESNPVQGRVQPTKLSFDSQPAALSHTPNEFSMPTQTQERREYDSTPRSNKRQTQQRQEDRQDPPEQVENPDAEPPEEKHSEPEVKLSKPGEGWSTWIDEATQIVALEEAFGQLADRSDLTRADKLFLTGKINEKIKSLKSGPPGQLFETSPHA